jgi:hypothetical protein
LTCGDFHATVKPSQQLERNKMIIEKIIVGALLLGGGAGLINSFIRDDYRYEEFMGKVLGLFEGLLTTIFFLLLVLGIIFIFS